MASPFPEGHVSCRAGASQPAATLPTCGCSPRPPPSQPAAPSWCTPNLTMQGLAAAPSQGPIRSVQHLFTFTVSSDSHFDLVASSVLHTVQRPRGQRHLLAGAGEIPQLCCNFVVVCPRHGSNILTEADQACAACCMLMPLIRAARGQQHLTDRSRPGARSIASRPRNAGPAH